MNYNRCMIIQRLEKEGVAHPPKWLSNNTAYLTVMGSNAYAVSSDNSDQDIYGFCLPPKDIVFPWLAGEIPGFGEQLERFKVWDQHHIRSGGKEYDFAVYNIVYYFNLCMQNNPNIIDSLYTPVRCVKHITEVGTMVRDNRRVFLHKGSWHKFKGYAFQQLHKMELKRKDNPEVAALREYAAARGIDLATSNWDEIKDVEFASLAATVTAKGRRYVGIAQYGFDVKFAYHVVRLINEVEQILEEGDLDLERSREQLKSIRRGEWSMERIQEWFASRENDLNTTYANSKLPHTPDVDAIKTLLLNCLEHHYGTISQSIVRDTPVDVVVAEMQKVLDRYK